MTHLILTASSLLNFNSVTEVYMNLYRGYKRWKSVRHTISELTALSDRELNDLGIHRGMIHSIAVGTRRD